LPDVSRRHASRPEAIVEYGEHGVRRLTWGEFDASINRLAQARWRGLRGGGWVALMLPNGAST
jgi:acyl-CoA synthetase (AMP-forming)/AMP-acid ligase II